jgi:chromosome segregation ATPase
MGDTTLSALSELRRALDRAAAKRAEAAKVVEEIQAPLRRLEAEQAAEDAARIAFEEATAKKAQLEYELFDIERDLGELEPRAAHLVTAIETLDWLAERAQRGFGNLSAGDVGRVAHQARSTLELLETRRDEAKRIKALLRSLGA